MSNLAKRKPPEVIQVKVKRCALQPLPDNEYYGSPNFATSALQYAEFLKKLEDVMRRVPHPRPYKP